MKKLYPLIACLLVIGVLLGSFGCAAPKEEAPELPKVVALASPPVGITYQVCAVGIASVLRKHTEMSVVNKPMSGPLEYLPMLNTGEIMLSLTSANEAVWGFTGDPRISAEPLKNLRRVVHGNFLTGNTFIVTQKSGIRKIAELRGKRVSGDYGPHPIVAAINEAWLGSVGLTWSDVTMVPAPGILDGVADLREGRVDATFGGNIVSGYLHELHAAVPVRLLNFADTPPDKIDQIPQSVLDNARKALPVGQVGSAGPKDPVCPEKFTSFNHPNNLLASKYLSEQAVYLITKALFENYEELWAYHAWLKQWKPELMFDPNSPLPYHPGAVRFFKEIGVWTAEAEKQQQALLQ